MYKLIGKLVLLRFYNNTSISGRCLYMRVSESFAPEVMYVACRVRLTRRVRRTIVETADRKVLTLQHIRTIRMITQVLEMV